MNIFIFRLMFPLPKKTPDGSTVFFTCKNPNLTGFSKVYVPEFIRYYLLSLYVLIWVSLKNYSYTVYDVS